MDIKAVVRGAAVAVLARLGTALAVWLASHGIPDELIEQLIVAIGVIGGIVFEIVVALILRGRRFGNVG